MKITHINTLYHPCITGGAQRSVQTLSEALACGGDDVTVVAISETEEEMRYKHNGVSVIKLPVANIYNPYASGKYNSQPWPARAVWHLRDRYNPIMARKLMSIEAFRTADILSFHCMAGFSSSAWAAAVQCERPIVATLHDYYALCARSAMYNARNRAPCPKPCPACSLLRRPARRLSQHVDAVIGVSRFILEKHLECGCFSNAAPHVICNTYDRGAEVVIEPGRRARRFGYLGSLFPEKGLDVLIEAFREFDDAESELHIFGSGQADYVDKLKARAAGEKIYWKGVVKSEIALDSVDVLVVPSMWDEPFGRVVIEALSTGVAVIGAARGGITEILADRSYSLLFDPRDKSQLTSAFQKYVAASPEEFEQVRRAAVKRGKQFSARNHYERFRAICQDVLSAREKKAIMAGQR